MAWNMMEENNCLPPNPEFLHYLWAFAFMQLHLANNTTLSTLLGERDPKTLYKYLLPFIWSIFASNEIVVS
jgi:hypothetical protein